VDTLLLADRELKKSFPAGEIYRKDCQGNIVKNKFNASVFSTEYCRQYNLKLNGMIEKQMQVSIKETASFWYTAWVNAGKPDLSDLDPADQTARYSKNLKKERKVLKQGKLMNIKK